MSPVRQPSGVVAIARCPSAPTLAQALDGQPALVPILTGVQDPGNVGAIMRAAEACGATGIITTDGTADPFGWKALRGAMGSTFRLPIAVHQPLTAIFERAAVARNRRDCDRPPRRNLPPCSRSSRQPAALILGGEGAGLPPDAGCVGGRAAHDPDAAARSSRSTLRSRPRWSCTKHRGRGGSTMSLFDDPETQAAPDADRHGAARRAHAAAHARRVRRAGSAHRAGPSAPRSHRARPPAVDHPLGSARAPARRRWRG